LKSIDFLINYFMHVLRYHHCCQHFCFQNFVVRLSLPHFQAQKHRDNDQLEILANCFTSYHIQR